LSAVLDEATVLSLLLVARLEGANDDPEENLRLDVGVLGAEIGSVGKGDIVGRLAARLVNLLAQAVNDLGANVQNVHVAVERTGREREKKKTLGSCTNGELSTSRLGLNLKIRADFSCPPNYATFLNSEFCS
jgi:hypothetical protein